MDTPFLDTQKNWSQQLQRQTPRPPHWRLPVLRLMRVRGTARACHWCGWLWLVQLDFVSENRLKKKGFFSPPARWGPLDFHKGATPSSSSSSSSSSSGSSGCSGWRLDPNSRTPAPNTCQRECQKQCQKEYQIECQIDVRKYDRCQIECQNRCQIECQQEGQIEYQSIYMPDRMAEPVCHI